MALQQIIEQLYSYPVEKIDREKAFEAIRQLKEYLNRGEVRAAEYQGGAWHLNRWVKKGILLAFRLGSLSEYQSSNRFRYFDKNTMDVKRFTLDDDVRIVPGGSTIRDGAYIGKSVIMMPPSYINIGAYVDEQTMIDSHALVGSCAQIGKRVHISAGTQIGGVLEPIGTMPVIIEDDVFIGGNCGIYEGTVVKKRAVIGAGVILTGSTPVYDIIKNKIHRKTAEEPLTIQENAVVVPGCRQLGQPFAKEHNLSIYSPIIIKYRDEKTDLRTILEDALRSGDK